MSNFNYHVRYRNGRRYLPTMWGEPDKPLFVTFRFNKSHENVQGKGIALSWYNYSAAMTLKKQVGLCRNVRAFIPFENEKHRFAASYAVLTGTGIVLRFPIDVEPPPKITECMSVARSLAAGKCPPTALAGWIEDNWPEPWCLLASPEPIALIRTLSPLPLLETA